MLNTSLLRKFASIRLTENEAKVFASLLEASEALGKSTVLRAAGGWVRDKLMGFESCDIDIALDNIPGDEFALFVHEREQKRGNCSGIGIVKENPLQSKHIRTASFRFHGLDLDVNNLRSESYTEDSRIPEVKFASHPSEDALRRDFTVNALYYNLNTEQVEDFTGTGLADLDAHVIRTPLPAKQTFIDDPLRVLRAIRFSTRFGFRLDGEIVEAWKDEAVQAGLSSKVSRERIGIEIGKMMHHPTGAPEAVYLLYSSSLIRLILPPPSDARVVSLTGVSKKDYTAWLEAWAPSTERVGNLVDPSVLTSRLVLPPAFPFEQRSHLYFSVLFFETIWQKRNPNPLLVARLAMKLSNKDCKLIAAVLMAIEPMQAVMKSRSVVELGRLIRNSVKENFPSAILLAILSARDVDSSEILSRFDEMMELVTSNHLQDCADWKPVVDGLEIQTVFKLKPGKVIQDLLTFQFDLMCLGERDKTVLMQKIGTYLEHSS